MQSTFESFLVWIDHHPNLRVWILAIGVPGSLWVALFLYHRKEAHRRAGDQKRAKRVITQVKRALAGLRVKLNEMETAPLKKKKIHFFFQAEDGIRDPLVTGVQTCALPI